MNTEELRKKKPAELNKELDALLQERFKLRMQMGFEQESIRPHDVKRVRRAIARIKTILNEKAKESHE